MTQTTPIQITERAIKRIQHLLAKPENASTPYLRVGVRGGGCAGLEYVLRFEMSPRATDHQFAFEDFHVIMDPKSAELLQDCVLDFTGELLGGGFRVQNPHAKRSCGCGTSFSPI